MINVPVSPDSIVTDLKNTWIEVKSDECANQNL